MNTKLVLGIGLMIGIGGFSFFLSQKAPNQMTKPAETSKKNEADTNPDTSMVTPASDIRYVAYSQAAFESAKGKKRVYFFFAPWCPTCVPADKEFQAGQEKIPEDVVLFRTDYDSSRELKKRYAVTYQHTYVSVDDNGEAVKKWNGGGLAELITNTR